MPGPADRGAAEPAAAAHQATAANATAARAERAPEPDPDASLRPWPATDPVLIAGGGIGGLAAALALARRNIPSRVLERRPQFSEDGAGIQLGPNATRILADLRVAPHLAPHVGAPDAIHIRDGATGRDLGRLPLGHWMTMRHGAPYWVAHRRDLHAALLETATAAPLITLETGAQVDTVAVGSDGLWAQLASSNQRSGAALIAADGLWSSLRTRLLSAPQPAFAGKRALRAVVPADAVPIPGATADTGVWLSPDAHVVHYPVRGGDEIAVVGIFDETEASRDWSQVVTRDEVTRRVARFANPIRALFATDVEWRAWSLARLDPLPYWTRGPIAVLGDAAHPMLPFLAQGAVMALEDAVTLAACLARIAKPAEIPAALAHYAGLRQRRAARVQSASVENGRIYHLTGAMARARDLTLRYVSGERLMARYDWLYGWRAMA